MVFSKRIAVLAAVVAIPLGIATTSYVLTDSPSSAEVPRKVELDSGSPSATPTKPTPSDEVVSRPPVHNDASGDDDDRDTGDADDGPRDDG
ncbi:small secreted hydrophilic protein [Streptomyces sp. DG2A-72]|uniref:small secreted hydrophilic protein n=1 Tax=Streptomyces sp. DG2A-72 TaxID=3051386 RepID=UPI00265B797E|nr:small secreted hydrophilic protein [Streptomyces sp. DG2A-72]MDO0930369.1 small secreted hydrophilic protein [Streptomyces sp. DG2A-72]